MGDKNKKFQQINHAFKDLMRNTSILPRVKRYWGLESRLKDLNN